MNLSKLMDCYKDIEYKVDQTPLQSPACFELRNNKIHLLNEEDLNAGTNDNTIQRGVH